MCSSNVLQNVVILHPRCSTEAYWYSEMGCARKPARAGIRLGIHYNTISNIMIQAHAFQVIVLGVGWDPRAKGR